MASQRSVVRIFTNTLTAILTLSTPHPLSPQQPVSITDSAGVRIVESSSPAWSAGDEWQLGPDPILTIDDVSGDPNYMFEGVSQAFRMDDGTIVVVDRLASEVGLFDPAGVFIRSLGGRGEGPGEFHFLQYVWANGDTIRASDSMLSRISVFDRDGNVLETIPVEVAPDTGIPTARTEFADGTVLVLNAPSGGVRPGTGDVIEGGSDAPQYAADPAAWARYLREVPFPERIPVYRRLLLDTEQHLWAERYMAPWEEAPSWYVFDEQGAWLGEVDIPPGLHVFEIGTDYVLGRYRDEFDVQSVVLIPLDRGDDPGR